MITKGAFLILTFGTLAFAAGCSDEAVPVGGDFIETPEGFPFVTGAVLVSDLCAGSGQAAQSCALAKHPPLGATMVELSQPEAGKLCVQGSIGQGGWAFVLLGFTEYEDVEPAGHLRVVKTLDADALGIQKVSFKLDSPPKDGLTVFASTLKQMECTGNGRDCRLGDFFLSDPVSKEVVSFSKSATITAPLVDFRQTVPENDPEFDTSVLDGLYLSVAAPGPVNFCVSELTFLDAEEKPVLPEES